MTSTIVLYPIVFIFGLIFGSFYNVVGLRVPQKESIVYPSSHCSHCERLLTSLELIPVISYLFLKGKCKGCGVKISPLYPSMELLTACLFTIAPMLVGWSKELLIAWSLISLLVIITVSDLRYQLIPNKVLLFFSILFILLRLALPMDPWWDPLAGMVLGFTLLFLIAWISKGGMGGGDIKLFAVLGLVLGWKGIMICFFFSSFFGGLVGGLGIIIGKMHRKQAIPFGPFIALGAIISYYFGDKILKWYFHLYLF